MPDQSNVAKFTPARRRPVGTGWSAVVTGLLAGALLAPGTAAAAADITGAWSGGGTVTLSSGAQEKARCRASFSPAGGSTVAMAATCATPSAKVSQTAILSRYSGSRYGGTFHNPEYGVTGRIRITVSGNRQTVYLTGGGGRATFSLKRR